MVARKRILMIIKLAHANPNHLCSLRETGRFPQFSRVREGFHAPLRGELSQPKRL